MGRTNSTANSREEDTSKRVGGEKQTVTLGSPHGEEESPLNLALKTRRAEFVNSYNLRDLKPGILKISGLNSGRSCRA